jgi:Transglutaminase-like superfamily
LKSLIERVRRLLGLTPRERRLLLFAWLLFLLVDLALLLCPVTLLLPRRKATGTGAARVPVERLAWLVRVAGRHGWRRAGCLQEAIVLAWLLHRAGVPANVRIGVARRAGVLQAHAWLEHGGATILEAPDGVTYEPLLPAAPANRT